MAGAPRFVLVLDFDGTVTEKDIGDEVCSRFAPPSWRDIDAMWLRNEISLPEAQRRMWAMARCHREEAVAYAREVGVLRPGLDPLLDGVHMRGGEVWLASGGFDFYIEALLDGRTPRFARRYFNHARFVDGGIEVAFPHAELSCERCAVCKGRVCDAARAIAPRVIFVGDGASDRCALGRVDELCAVEGSLLEATCQAGGQACRSFRTFQELLAMLG
jgi:2,3-diketo-5-methylthio-1-phosphopentane phosphatase